MPDIGKLVREEISRLTGTAIRREVRPLRKQARELTRDVARLKRINSALEKKLVRLAGEAEKRSPDVTQVSDEELRTARVSPRSIKSLRSKLGMSRNDFAALAGVSANSVYLWEMGKAKPKTGARATLVGLRKLGVREARRRLEAMTNGSNHS